jgi:FkbM family methyltransferase
MGLRFRDVLRSMIEVFVGNEWGFLDVKGRHVIDVGAFNGDSSIYFVINGAEKVIAVEPHPRAYAELLINIRLNGLQSKITPINVALGRDGFITLPIDVSLDAVIDKIYEGEICEQSRVVKVKSTKLSDLLELVDVRPDVLKLDCEGCEFNIIEGDYSGVRSFKELGIECHLRCGRLRDLIDCLSRDFRCKVVKILHDRAIIHCVRE